MQRWAIFFLNLFVLMFTRSWNSCGADSALLPIPQFLSKKYDFVGQDSYTKNVARLAWLLSRQIWHNGQESFRKNWHDGQDYLLIDFGTTGNILFKQTWYDGQDSFTRKLRRRARLFFDKVCMSVQLKFAIAYKKLSFIYKNLTRRARFFKPNDATGKIVLR